MLTIETVMETRPLDSPVPMISRVSQVILLDVVRIRHTFSCTRK